MSSSIRLGLAGSPARRRDGRAAGHSARTHRRRPQGPPAGQPVGGSAQARSRARRAWQPGRRARRTVLRLVSRADASGRLRREPHGRGLEVRRRRREHHGEHPRRTPGNGDDAVQGPDHRRADPAARLLHPRSGGPAEGQARDQGRSRGRDRQVREADRQARGRGQGSGDAVGHRLPSRRAHAHHRAAGPAPHPRQGQTSAAGDGHARGMGQTGRRPLRRRGAPELRAERLDLPVVLRDVARLQGARARPGRCSCSGSGRSRRAAEPSLDDGHRARKDPQQRLGRRAGDLQRIGGAVLAGELPLRIAVHLRSTRVISSTRSATRATSKARRTCPRPSARCIA